ncbi:protein of unknown function [Blastococcus saxobsidens DD2]|uniref:Uncharacterized protein n=1 Tax=Blastococcus saxobsidens (strain DD2) TaxID=1146883 RepID=H6RTL7_BLASD|nr:protein of unknown function [Blastococcus saxobsidens DD2]
MAVTAGSTVRVNLPPSAAGRRAVSRSPCPGGGTSAGPASSTRREPPIAPLRPIDGEVRMARTAAGHGPASLRARVLREAAVVAVLTIAFAVAAIRWNWPGELGGPADDIVLVLAFSHLLMMVFGKRRSDELKAEVVSRREAEQQLRHRARQLPHRPAQPGGAHRGARHGPRRDAGGGPADRGGAAGPRPVQGGQRHAGPPRRRHAAPLGGPATDRRAARGNRAGPAGRRRVRAGAARLQR